MCYVLGKGLCQPTHARRSWRGLRSKIAIKIKPACASCTHALWDPALTKTVGMASMHAAFMRAVASLRGDPSDTYCEHAQGLVLRGCEVTTKLLGPILICLAVALIALVTFTFFDGIMPALHIPAFSFTWLIVTTFGIWILANLVFNYGASILVAPGHPKGTSTREEEFPSERGGLLGANSTGVAASASLPRLRGAGTGVGGDVESGRPTADVSHLSPAAPARPHPHPPAQTLDDDEQLLRDPNRAGFCKTCQFAKPARCHHCHVCNKCVLKMDHHCPWLGACVGFHNVSVQRVLPATLAHYS